MTVVYPCSGVCHYDDVVFLFHPPHLLYHLHAPLPDNSIVIVIVVSVWIIVCCFVLLN